VLSTDPLALGDGGAVGTAKALGARGGVAFGLGVKAAGVAEDDKADEADVADVAWARARDLVGRYALHTFSSRAELPELAEGLVKFIELEGSDESEQLFEVIATVLQFEEKDVLRLVKALAERKAAARGRLSRLFGL
jgi:hypothetical protein